MKGSCGLTDNVLAGISSQELEEPVTFIEFGKPPLRKSGRSLAALLILFCLLWILVFAQSVAGKHEDNTSDQKAAVARVEDHWLNSLNNANVDTVADILADDFIRPAPDSGQFVTKADLISYYRSHLKPITPDRRRIDDMTVSVYGNSAIARGLVIRSAVNGRVISKLLFTDVFVQRNGKWQAVSAQENPVTIPQSPGH